MVTRWLDVGEDDGKLERELVATPPGELWTLTTVTTPGDDGGTRGPGVMVIYTDKGRSKEVVFGDEEQFEFKDTQTFPLYVSSVMINTRL